MAERTPVHRHVVALVVFSLVVASLVVASLVVGASRAGADTAPLDPHDPATPPTVSADGLPTAQLNGVAWAQAVVGNTVYVGGSFTSARPAGAAPGTDEVARTNLLAYDVTTGQLVPHFAPSVNGQVRTLAASPDGSRLYIGGSFTAIDGRLRHRIAAFDTTTGALVDSFKPPVNYDVYSIAATDTTVFAGGDFQGVGTRKRGYLASFTASTGALLDWAPQAAGGKVWAIALNGDGTKLAVAGQFTTLNGSGSPGYGLGMVDAATGASLPMPANAAIRNAGADAGIVSLSSDGTNLYGSGFMFGSGGTLEGTFAVRWADGSLVWVNDCHGDTYSVHVSGGVLYSVGHAHYCGNMGGFPQTEPSWNFYRGLAFGTEPTDVADRDPYGYPSHRGLPTSSLLTWYPRINAGTVTGMSQGAWSVAGNGAYVVVAGEFTKVDNRPQQGLVRFPAAEISPNAQGPTLFGTAYPLKVTSTQAGTVRINWPSNQDIDNDALTYRVYRDGQLRAGLVHERRARARFWEPFTMGFTDTGLVPGSTHRYRVVVTDATGNPASSPWNTVTVATTGSDSAYVKAVRASQPVDLWRLGDPRGATATDSIGFSPLYTGSGVTEGAAGAIAGDTDKAMTFSATSTGIGYTDTRISPPREFSVEAWFKTNTTTGGKLVGFGDSRTGPATRYDRHVYLDDSGRVVFGVNDGTPQVLTSPRSYADNAWHHVVASLTRTAGMRLYLDGALVGERVSVRSGEGGYWGWWRIGGGNLDNWPSRPSSRYFGGDLDEVALYHRGLHAGEVQAHYAAGIGADPTYARDGFGRTVSSGWGDAEVGGAWTHSGTATNFAVTGGAGTIRMASAGAGPSIRLAGVSSSDTEVRTTVALDREPTGGGTYLTVRPRLLTNGDSYYVSTRVHTGGAVSLITGTSVAGVDTALRSVTLPGLSVAPGERLQIRAQAVGTSTTTVRAKVWKRGQIEPADWAIALTDRTAALQEPGAVGLSTYLSGSSTSAPTTASFDDLWAGPTP